MLNSPPAIMGVLHKQQDRLGKKHIYQCWNVVDAKKLSKWKQISKILEVRKVNLFGGIENTIVKERNINKIVVFVQILYTGL